MPRHGLMPHQPLEEKSDTISGSVDFDVVLMAYWRPAWRELQNFLLDFGREPDQFHDLAHPFPREAF